MIWLKTIFPIYLLLLACLPCADNCSMEISPVAAINIATNEHEHNDVEKESCSPFCICDCCGIRLNTLTPFQLATKPIVFSSSKKQPVYTFSFQEVLYNIWQPPQNNC